MPAFTQVNVGFLEKTDIAEPKYSKGLIYNVLLYNVKYILGIWFTCILESVLTTCHLYHLNYTLIIIATFLFLIMHGLTLPKQFYI